MKYLKMFSKMNHTNGGQMVFGMEQPFVDIESIRDHTLKMGVQNEKCKNIGISIICRTEENLYFAAPPLDYSELYSDINYSTLRKESGKLTKEEEVALKEKEALFNTYMKNIKSFIPFMLKAFKLAEDGIVLQIVVKNNEWELEEVE